MTSNTVAVSSMTEQDQTNYQVHVVLVRTLYERNVGAVARAMTNMGALRLILIGRKCELTIEANHAAASGQTPFENRIEYQTWDEFTANEDPDGIRLCFTARDGRGRLVHDFSETLVRLKTESPVFQENKISGKPVQLYLIFGPEDWGLDAKDLEYGQRSVTIPTYGTNTSLNLAQAVLLALFILRNTWGGEVTQLDGQRNRKRNVGLPNIFPDETLRKWLLTMRYDLSKKKINVYTVIRRMILANAPTQKELRILESVWRQSIRRMSEKIQTTDIPEDPLDQKD
ncbi:MAG: TrmH family RNA methyltransferase [Pseudobdellovibrionaceae bacterium]